MDKITQLKEMKKELDFLKSILQLMKEKEEISKQRDWFRKETADLIFDSKMQQTTKITPDSLRSFFDIFAQHNHLFNKYSKVMFHPDKFSDAPKKVQELAHSFCKAM